MKWLLVPLLVMAILALTALANEDVLLDDESLDDLEETEAILREIEQGRLNTDLARETELALKIVADALKEQEQTGAVQIDPCSNVRCGAGRVCQAEGNDGSCVCIPECPVESDPRRKVCTNRNETWNSDCEVYRHRCLCDANDAACQGPELKHIHIDYYGICKSMPECTDEEMEDFPRRMREWLFNIMRDLVQREEINDHYKAMEVEAETNMTRRWANAAVWKWCDLDLSHDRSVSRHELFPIRAPLMSLEHCIAPFLESCDPNDDHRITLQEWGNCLKLDEADMLDQCDELLQDKTIS